LEAEFRGNFPRIEHGRDAHVTANASPSVFICVHLWRHFPAFLRVYLRALRGFAVFRTAAYPSGEEEIAAGIVVAISFPYLVG
jgi:hypothetical protein